MKKLFIILLILLSFSGYAQQTVFDLAGFTPPAGWKKDQQKDLVMLSAPENKNNTFCIITVYKSIEGTGDGSGDFQYAWKTLVAERLSVTNAPEVEKGDPVNGWNSSTATTTFSFQGSNAVVVLTNFSGYNKSMSMLVITNDAASQQTVEQFFNSVDLKKPAMTNQVPAEAIVSPGTLSDYQFTAPPGWTIVRSNNEITLNGPDKQSTLSLLPMVKGSGNLEQDMAGMYWQVFAGFEKDPYNPDHHIITRGTSPDGWNYLKEEMGIRKMIDGKAVQVYGFVMLVQLGNRVAVIAGSFADTKSLLWETINVDWQLFFHSLAFKNFKGNGTNPLQPALLGKWMTGSYSGMVSYIFAANGHFASGAAYSSSRVISEYQLLEKTTSFVGDGTYALMGNQLSMTNARTKKVQSSALRIYDQFQYGGWTKHIGLLSKSAASDGKLYEVTLVEQKD